MVVTEGCRQRVEVPVAVLAAVQDEAEARFLVAPGHEQPGTDEVVLEAPGYSIVAVEAAKVERALTALIPSLLGAGIR